MLGGSFWTTSRVYMQLRGGGAEGLQIFDKISMQYICIYVIDMGDRKKLKSAGIP